MKRTYIPVNNKFSSEKIFYDEIVLLEKEINNINIITAKGNVCFRGKADDMRKYVEGRDDFFPCHSYLIVNMKQVTRVEGGNIYFANGEYRHLGRRNYLRVKAAYANYIA